MMDVEQEKEYFLILCGKRDRALLSGKRMTLGDMERLTYLTEFFELEATETPYGKEFGDDVKRTVGSDDENVRWNRVHEDRWL